VHNSCCFAESTSYVGPPAPKQSELPSKKSYSELPTSSKWHSHNVRQQELAHDLNETYHLVGLPKHRVYFMFGRARTNERSDFFHLLGPYIQSFLEVQYSESEAVSRFRFVQKVEDKFIAGPYSQWETNDLGQDGKLEPPLINPDPLGLNQLSIRFDREVWRTNSYKRLRMVWDLTHSFDFFGMRQGIVHNFIGYPVAKSRNLDQESEFYSLSQSDVCGLPTQCLEVSYLNDCVSGIRVTTRSDVR
jgi:hypothetical protein